MTDAEIIKALECCIKTKTFFDCEKVKCPALTQNGCLFCLRTNEDHEFYIEIFKEALDLINRQKAKIDFSRNINHLQMEELQTAKAEIERLKAECGNQSTLWSQHYESIFETSKETIKAEAIEEFAERFENELTKIEDFYFEEEHENFISENKVIALLVNLVKEMEGEAE